MKVVFHGMFEEREGGCKPCGQRVTSKHVFASSRSFILPSGISKNFHINEETEVSDIDGEFLLSYSYVDANGLKRDIFTRVD